MEIGCILSDDELIAAVKSAVDDVCRTGGKSLVLRVPPDPNKDLDLLIVELCQRFDSLSKEYQDTHYEA